MERGGSTYYYTFDGLGSVVELTDDNGNVVETYSYDSFGGLRVPPTIDNPYTYTSREYDPETHLYYYRNRYYDPAIGRFTTIDPTLSKNIFIPYLLSDLVTHPTELNTYLYVSNNPINNIDPLGLRECCPAEDPTFHLRDFVTCLGVNLDKIIAALPMCAICFSPIPVTPWIRVTACTLCGVMEATVVLKCIKEATYCD
jgi:RHS repeat-associated protein